ncbi:hypothetical protein BUALT_Bualt08G0138900 [Buddleja alternifolia]|uniref:Protein kinase domain-containing protein n=1 Tax=Buddleja alternifolia TaxID=168488 RepID=A0AAV6XED9_9LAMI|nr:hypothetical protein BUALT_Bualt08G0138900 [Buddleja alternifolia]
MEFVVLINLVVLLIIIFALTPTISITPPNYNVTKPNCVDHCGNISIPFPFGTTENCYHSYGFFVTCNHTFNPPKLFMQDGEIEITDISPDGQLKVLQYIASDCYTRNGSRIPPLETWIELPISMTVNNTANKFTIVGCDTYGFVFGRRLDRNYTTGCTAMCDSMQDLVEGSCMGLGCCQNDIPRDVWRVEIDLRSYDNHTNVWDFNNCSYAFFAEESAFNFSRESLTTLRNVRELPMVADWAIGNGTCEEARMNSSSYACVSTNSRCYKPNNGYGYRCRCEDGFEGNPYLINGCQDIDECVVQGLNNCKHDCKNTVGGFQCPCRKGYRGDGRIGGEGCSPGESLMLKLLAGIAVGVIGLLLALCCLYLEFKRRRSNGKKQKFFLQNGGALLQEKLIRRERSRDIVKIFSSLELAKATNNFHGSRVIGQGGFGTVYKGLLPDNNVVAIKKSKRVDPNQIDQFINEVIVLSQINHRNVVRLLGCCLETEVPLLVYEFIDNGTLAANIHNQGKARFLDWSMRLKIAAEAAGVLSYLHSAAFTPIIHRDVKSDNILLDRSFTAKVSDFGASRFIPLDKTQLSTMVQGTFGYLDPEYMQTNQLTEKSDVYSFGVVLVELLTGRKALSFDRPEDEQNLANFFLSVLKKEQLLQVLDVNIVGEGNMEQIIEVARLAEWCLHVKGEDRPSMKQVAMKLEGLRLGGKHSWAQTEQNAEEMESLISEGFDGLACGDGNSTITGYDSVREHVILPISGGR